MTPYLIVGLGNPGAPYRQTRHNLGFRVIDRLATTLAIVWKKEPDVISGLATVNNDKIFLIKPQTFVNDSGTPVQRFLTFYKVPVNHLLVIHDDLDLPFGELRPAFDRGPAGHNGVTDIIAKLDSQAFHRLRIGIGSNRNVNISAEDYVLQKFSAAEDTQLNATSGTVVVAADWVANWIRSS